MSSFRLQKLLKEFSDVDLVPHTDVDNYKFNGKWITEIDKDYYKEISSEILEILQDNEGEIGEVKSSLKEAKERTLKKWLEVTTEGDGKLTILKHYTPIPPIKSTLDFLDDKEQIERREIIFDTVVELWDLDLGNYNKDDLHSYLRSPEAQNTEKQIKFKYSYGHLYYVLSIRVEVIDNLLKEIEELDESVNPHLMPQKSTNPYSMEFNLKKVDIALFFEILLEEEIIKMEGRDKEERKRNLRKYIDNANLTYVHDGKKIPVVDIKKEFSKLKSTRLYNIVDNEKLLLEDLIQKFQKRLKKFENESSGEK